MSRISYRAVLHEVRLLWSLLALEEGGYSQRIYRQVLRAQGGQLRTFVNLPRRTRSCLEAVRQPVAG